MPKISSSAARPPVSVAILFSSSSRLIRSCSLLVHLHGVAQRAGGARDDGDLGDRRGVGLQWPRPARGRSRGRRRSRFSFVADARRSCAGTGDDRLDALLQISLRARRLRPMTHGTERGLVDDVGQVRARRAAVARAMALKSTSSAMLHVFGVHLQDGARGPAGRAAPPGCGGRSGRDAAAPGPATPGGWSRPG